MNHDSEIALRAAMNVLRDAAEPRWMPNGLTLGPAEIALHADAANLVDDTRKELARADGAGQTPGANS